MAYLQTVPLVIYILGGGLLGLISWGFIKFFSLDNEDITEPRLRDDEYIKN